MESIEKRSKVAKNLKEFMDGDVKLPDADFSSQGLAGEFMAGKITFSEVEELETKAGILKDLRSLTRANTFFFNLLIIPYLIFRVLFDN